jgi:hypothetical protein
LRRVFGFSPMSIRGRHVIWRVTVLCGLLGGFCPRPKEVVKWIQPVCQISHIMEESNFVLGKLTGGEGTGLSIVIEIYL